MWVGILPNIYIYMETTILLFGEDFPIFTYRYESGDSKVRLSGEKNSEYHFFKRKILGKQASQLPNRYEARSCYSTSMYVGLQGIGKVSSSAWEVLSIRNHS